MPPGTRDALVDVAARLLDEGGVPAVTLREVGRLAGVSHNAPYKHFASKERLLAAIAARELARQGAALGATMERERSPEAILRATLRHYVAWALDHPARFKLTFGKWSIDSDELDSAARDAQTLLVQIVTSTQEAGALPPGDPVRLASLLRALAHGAADLASTGHLESGGKGHAGPEELIDDLLGYLRGAAAHRPR
ncbi:TetR/AcrR family transcriptional regulator [Plantactinospora sp. KLBMP9567]|uniref:TetR/AcrR family transcriptional regulator n=1 Tax=unclassified Plantactinospora TaxID=2631981 RepID=UPI0029829919|nr:TetR/AcrR family transcriptional regulator [Plantactinospora sp. KLBMP9567]MDW5328222.1 TetR/AcrR family transcriptional regulator [Plantactinospora sp. KLBMP9567]